MNWSGRSYRDIALVSARSRYKISRSTAENLTAGRTVPTLKSLTGFLYGCGLDVPEKRQSWLDKYRQVYPAKSVTSRRATAGDERLSEIGKAPFREARQKNSGLGEILTATATSD